MAGITIGLIALPLALAPWNRQHPRRHADALPSASGGIIYRNLRQLLDAGGAGMGSDARREWVTARR